MFFNELILLPTMGIEATMKKRSHKHKGQRGDRKAARLLTSMKNIQLHSMALFSPLWKQIKAFFVGYICNVRKCDEERLRQNIIPLDVTGKATREELQQELREQQKGYHASMWQLALSEWNAERKADGERKAVGKPIIRLKILRANSKLRREGNERKKACMRKHPFKPRL